MSDYKNDFVLVISAPEVSRWLYVFDSNPPLASQRHFLWMLMLLFVLVVDVVGCPLHLGLKAVWFATTHAGWSRLHDWHGWRGGGGEVVLAISASVTACRIFMFLFYFSSVCLFVCLFSCTFTITIITSSMITMSGCFLIGGCVLWKGSCLASQLFFSLKIHACRFP